ncbi:hypothetical protein DICPUDRAFT_91101 [Dictyostelium purpureum]|uniref:Uncharacterized protein n=1 Tax=Dictyostelium purpureum TaxID=5786 RepID=F0Z7M4_DICPU|nr:uncharacterized protein DICPUDRAFT_91101 [Dictyostelium purpureum]EGC40090.1 hypothetical protein DICPUDRAFT_91101 [Dictyostelium purpureum]|eukprot:XP_003283439.1 hypothetical protein DICPUDRAFT_91101 [Dictyostelium purpureum]
MISRKNKAFYIFFLNKVHGTPLPKTTIAETLTEAINPFTGDPTAKFINYSSVFVVGYGIKSLFFGHHPHQEKDYPYMKSKRRTLAFMFA